MSAERVLLHLSGRQVEIFYVLLVSSGKYTFLPELYDIFGREATIKFLELFSGCKLAVPKLEKLEKLSRNSVVYVRVEQASKRNKPAVIKDLAEEYEVTEDRIRSIYMKTKKKLEKDLGFKALKKRHGKTR